MVRGVEEEMIMATDKMVKKPTQTPLLEVKDFSLSFRRFEKGLRETNLEVIRKLDLTINEGEIVAVVGASGSGKSLLANAILGVLPDHAVMKGTLNYKGEALSHKRLLALRGKDISLIPQSVNALDPLMKTGKQVQTVIRGKNKEVIRNAIFQKVGLAEEAGDRYPFELSGGMARRVLAATAMVSGAKLVIADEPTPGLDPDALRETIKHLRQMANDGKGIMLITHDIEAALQVADKVAVFNAGQTVEIARADDFSGKGEKLQHPYTKALWNALPQNEFITIDRAQHFESGSSDGGVSNLNVQGISYGYPNTPQLFKELNLSIKPGEIVGVFGYSGSGKSTMAQIIAGYLKPEMGTVMLDSQTVPVSGNHPIQLVWQHPEKAINPRWRMKQVLEEVGNLEPELLETFGIKKAWLERWPSELSGGELQRFCLARALVGNVKYLIADEMTTMLDAVTQAQIWQAVIKLARKRNIGVLAISHDHHLLQRVSNRVIDFSKLA